MRNLLRLFCCTIALLTSMIAFAQDQPVSGSVDDPKDNSPLAGATIVNRRTKNTTLTSETGDFTIAARPGEVLIISHVGRKTRELTVFLAATDTRPLDSSG